jgi:hypothetical protein
LNATRVQLTDAQTRISLLESRVSTLQAQNLSSRIGTLEAATLNSRVSSQEGRFVRVFMFMPYFTHGNSHTARPCFSPALTANMTNCAINGLVWMPLNRSCAAVAPAIGDLATCNTANTNRLRSRNSGL